jgi:hypothetical protein
VAFDPETVIAAYVAKLATISGIGNLYDYKREVRDEATAKALWWHEAQGRINAWSVTLDDAGPVTNARGPGFGAVGSGQAGTVTTGVRIGIDAVFGINDAAASEKTFRALVWSVVHAVNGDGKLIAAFTHQEPMEWARFGYLTLAGMYHVHYARLTTSVIGRTR